jgi:hypothetical protein
MASDGNAGHTGLPPASIGARPGTAESLNPRPKKKASCSVVKSNKSFSFTIHTIESRYNFLYPHFFEYKVKELGLPITVRGGSNVSIIIESRHLLPEIEYSLLWSKKEILFQEESNLGTHVSIEHRSKYAASLMTMIQQVTSSIEPLRDDADGGFISSDMGAAVSKSLMKEWEVFTNMVITDHQEDSAFLEAAAKETTAEPAAMETTVEPDAESITSASAPALVSARSWTLASSDHDNDSDDSDDSDYSDEDDNAEDEFFDDDTNSNSKYCPASDAFLNSAVNGAVSEQLRKLYGMLTDQNLLRNPLPTLDGIEYHLSNVFGKEEFNGGTAVYALLNAARSKIEKGGFTTNMKNRSEDYMRNIGQDEALQRLVVLFNLSILTKEQDRMLCEFFDEYMTFLSTLDDDTILHPLLRVIFEIIHQHDGYRVGGCKSRIILMAIEMAVQLLAGVRMDCEMFSDVILGRHAELFGKSKAEIKSHCINEVITNLRDKDSVNFQAIGSWPPLLGALGESYLSSKVWMYHYVLGCGLHESKRLPFVDIFKNGCAAATPQNPYSTEFTKKEIDDARQYSRELVCRMHLLALLIALLIYNTFGFICRQGITREHRIPSSFLIGIVMLGPISLISLACLRMRDGNECLAIQMTPYWCLCVQNQIQSGLLFQPFAILQTLLRKDAPIRVEFRRLKNKRTEQLLRVIQSR